MKSKLQFDRNAEDKFVKMLRSYNEAITGDNAKVHDFIPSDSEDIEKNALDTQNRSDDDDRDQATARAEHFMEELYDKCAELVVRMVEDFKAQDPMNDPALDIVLEYQSDGSSNLDLDVFGLASFTYTIMAAQGYATDRGGEGESKLMDQINTYKNRYK